MEHIARITNDGIAFDQVRMSSNLFAHWRRTLRLCGRPAWLTYCPSDAFQLAATLHPRYRKEVAGTMLLTDN
jgi:hypothetical protein